MVVGANSILYANMMQGFYKLGMLSPDGKCKAFDASGNGCASHLMPLIALPPHLNSDSAAVRKAVCKGLAPARHRIIRLEQLNCCSSQVRTG